MKTNEVAARLVALCRQGQFAAAQRELYSPNTVSIEPAGTPGPREVRGLAALGEKEKMFSSTFEVHRCEVSDPVVADAFFCCSMMVDVTERKSGARFPLNELCLYEVRDGKIVTEQFFYTPQKQ
jgi:ketosteroid isomerase-like protein